MQVGRLAVIKETILSLMGMIDDVIIWDRALSEDEVKELGSGTRPEKALAVKAEGKLATTWGKVKSYHYR